MISEARFKELQARVGGIRDSNDGGQYARMYATDMEEALQEIERLRKQKDGAYKERNQVVAAFATTAWVLGWGAGLAKHPDWDTAWEDDWRNIVFIDTPAGQVSWHIHDSEMRLFEHLPQYQGVWDKHSTENKYARLSFLSRPDVHIFTVQHEGQTLRLPPPEGGREWSWRGR